MELVVHSERERDDLIIETFTIDWDKQFDVDLHADIGTVTAEYILENFGKPDVIWAAPECTTYSLAAISKHRIKNEVTGNLDPISEYAARCDEINQHVLKLIEELNPKVFWIENPRATLQNMLWMKPYDKYKHLITYCQYLTDRPLEERRMKPTNLWTNILNPKLKPPCKNGMPCHVKAPRGSKSGTQGMKNAKDRSTYPQQLMDHIADVTIEYLLNN